MHEQIMGRAVQKILSIGSGGSEITLFRSLHTPCFSYRCSRPNPYALSSGGRRSPPFQLCRLIFVLSLLISSMMVHTSYHLLSVVFHFLAYFSSILRLFSVSYVHETLFLSRCKLRRAETCLFVHSSYHMLALLHAFAQFFHGVNQVIPLLSVLFYSLFYFYPNG